MINRNMMKALLVAVVGVGLLALFQLIRTSSQEMPNPAVFLEKSYVQGIDWHPNSQELAIVNSGADVYSIVDERLSYISNTLTAARVKWSSDGSMLALVGYKVQLWDGSDLVELADEARYRFFNDVIWSPGDEKIVVTSSGLSRSDNLIWIWDSKTHNLLGQISGDNSLQANNPSGDMGFIGLESVPNSSIVITTSWGNNAQRLWDISQLQATSSTRFSISSLAVVEASPLGDWLAIADDDGKHIQIVSLNGTSGPSILTSELTGIDVLAWNYRGDLLLGAGLDTDHISIWDVSQGRTILSEGISPTDQIRVDWHPEGNRVAIATDEEVSVWNIDRNERKAIHLGYAYDVQWSPDGEKLAVVSRNGVYIYLNQ